MTREQGDFLKYTRMPKYIETILKIIRKNTKKLREAEISE